MSESSALWDLLSQTAEPSVTKALEAAVASDPDRTLSRINPLVFAAERGLDEEATIGALVHSARLGLFDMSWNVLCPGCGGVLEAGAALKTLNKHKYFCAFCVADVEPDLDQLIEVTFTVNPRVRRIARARSGLAAALRIHAPDLLGFRRRAARGHGGGARARDARRHGTPLGREGRDVSDLAGRLRSLPSIRSLTRQCFSM